MAAHNALVYSGDLVRSARRLFGLGDSDDGLERMSESLQVSSDLWIRPDAAFVRQERLLAIVVTRLAGGAGTNSFVAIKNDSTNLLAIFTEVHAQTTGLWNLGVIVNTAAEIVAAAAQGGGVNRDTRWRLGSGQFTGRLPVLTGIPVGFAGISVIAQRAAQGAYSQGIVLAPGASLSAQAINTNVDITVGFTYSERVAYPGELVP